MNPFPADDARLRALVLHISLRCGEMCMPRFDISLLDRLLFQADFLHFRVYGFPITGQTYHRGPRSPSPIVLRRMVRRMIQSGEFDIREVDVGDGLHIISIPEAHSEPDLRIFDGQEIALVERVLWFFRQNRIAETEGPDLLEIPWELADLWEEIPYALALISSARNEQAALALRLVPTDILAQATDEAGMPIADTMRIPVHIFRSIENDRLAAAE